MILGKCPMVNRSFITLDDVSFHFTPFKAVFRACDKQWLRKLIQLSWKMFKCDNKHGDFTFKRFEWLTPTIIYNR